MFCLFDISKERKKICYLQSNYSIERVKKRSILYVCGAYKADILLWLQFLIRFFNHSIFKNS